MNWYNHIFNIFLNPLIMCMEGWFVGSGQEGGWLREGGGNCLKYLQSGWNRKEERESNDFEKGAS